MSGQQISSQTYFFVHGVPSWLGKIVSSWRERHILLLLSANINSGTQWQIHQIKSLDNWLGSGPREKVPGLQRAPSREEAEVARSCGKDKRMCCLGLGPARDLRCLGRSVQAPHGRSGAVQASQPQGFLSTEEAGLLESFLYGRCLSGRPICHLSRVILQPHGASEKLKYGGFSIFSDPSTRQGGVGIRLRSLADISEIHL